MKSLRNILTPARRLGFSAALLAGTLTMGTAPAFSASPNSETIQATVVESGNFVNVTLVIDTYSSPADLQTLSQAFQEGKDRGLVAALAKVKPVGRCSIAGAPGFEVAFIQMVATPTGRQITFIANRPLQAGEDSANAPNPSFDLAVGQFDLNDTDPAKSTGFLYPASKLAVDDQGQSHYDLAGNPLLLVNVLDTRQTSSGELALAPSK
jgi:hypothetical protein